tara:strand:+ start:32218 stop:32949 length:732 start_codon:yes stop_codon:yes gene_type:complete
MKLLITTRSDKHISEMTSLTHPFIKDYAKWCGADFLELDHISECKHEEGKWHYRIMKHYDLFNEYDRILSLDSDIVITPRCKNIFEEVPFEEIGTVYEDKGSRTHPRRATIQEVQGHFGDIGWSEGYINTGVFLTSNIHKDIFTKIDDKFWEGWGFDDIHLGYNINKNKFKVKELEHKWNHMTMFSEDWSENPNRFDSYIIHYAGYGIFDNRIGNRIDQIKYDLSTISQALTRQYEESQKVTN